MVPPSNSYQVQIAKLQIQVQVLERGQEQTRELMREHQHQTQGAIDKLESSIKPLGDAFQRAKGFQGAVIVFATVVFVGLGAGLKEAFQWFLSAMK